MHLLAELVAVATARRPEEPLESRAAVVAHEVLREELTGMLSEPERDRTVHWDPPPGPAPEAPALARGFGPQAASR
eukprot:9886093-Alexandrium_andersonii.AAC.1